MNQDGIGVARCTVDAASIDAECTSWPKRSNHIPDNTVACARDKVNRQFKDDYSGNIGEKQGQGMLLDGATALREREDLYLLVVGEGAGKAVLLLATAFGLDSIGQPCATLVASAAVHLVIQKRGAAESNPATPSLLSCIFRSLRIL